MDTVRGLTCSLYNGRITELLVYLATIFHSFRVPWSSRIEDNETLLPNSGQDGDITSNMLKEIATQCIWELVLQVYPENAKKADIETYEDFMNSQCLCCLIYYDCGLLDIYIQNQELLALIHRKLLLLDATDLEFITNINDCRALLHL